MSDDGFLRRLFAETCEPLRALEGPIKSQMLQFQLAAQRQQYAVSFPDAIDYVIESNENSIGRILISKDDDKVLIVDISLLPQWQGRGIGQSVVIEVVTDACAKNLPIELKVLKHSRAVQFYLKLCFQVISESDLYLRMRYEAN